MPALPKGVLSEESLLALLRREIVREGVGDKVLKSLIRHLADLALLQTGDGTHWKLAGTDPDSEISWAQILRERMIALCREKQGSALKFFIKNPPDNLPPSLFELQPEGFQGTLSEGLISPQGGLLPKTSSNLSNLQIVKKVGRQLSPFIELETRCLEKLEGTQTTRQDARNLFNFVIGLMKEKGTPRPWEQLSRRRHK